MIWFWSFALGCSGMSPAAPQQALPPAAAAAGGIAADLSSDHVVASWEGGSLTYEEIRSSIQKDLNQLETDFLQGRYQLQSQTAQGLALQKIVDAKASAAGQSTEDFIKAYVDSQVTPPTDEEIEEFYPMIRRQLRNAPLEEVRPQVGMILMQQKQEEAVSKYLDALTTEFKLEVSVPFPELPRVQVSVDDDPVRGPADAPITIIEFGDYECSFCARAYATVKQIAEDYDQVRIVYRDFPLSFHKRAIPAAVAANCAGEQGKYWEMHDLLMVNPQALQDSHLQSYAEQIGVDIEPWSACMEDPAQVAEVNKDMEEGAEAGVSGTPAFFVNGVFLNGAVPYEQFKAVIDQELANLEG